MHCLYANAIVQPSVQHYSCYMAWKTKIHTWCWYCHLCINPPCEEKKDGWKELLTLPRTDKKNKKCIASYVKKYFNQEYIEVQPWTALEVILNEFCLWITIRCMQRLRKWVLPNWIRLNLPPLNFEFLFDVLELFHSFKITPHLSKLIKADQFYNWKGILKIGFFIIFWMFSFVSKKAYSCKDPLSMCCITFLGASSRETYNFLCWCAD